MGQTVHQELAFWLIFFISLSLLWHIKPEQGLVPRTLNQQNFMSLPNKWNGLNCSVTSYMVHPSPPCWITHQELESQESAVSPVVRCTVLHLRWLHFWFALVCLAVPGGIQNSSCDWCLLVLDNAVQPCVFSKAVASYHAKVGVCALNLWGFSFTGCVLSTQILRKDECSF